jgi:hypothetical protein
MAHLASSVNWNTVTVDDYVSSGSETEDSDDELFRCRIPAGASCPISEPHISARKPRRLPPREDPARAIERAAVVASPLREGPACRTRSRENLSPGAESIASTTPSSFLDRALQPFLRYRPTSPGATVVLHEERRNRIRDRIE